MTIRRYFPGGNTYRGFRGFFDDLLAPGETRRALVLKGGPGVGKSTLMRRAGEMWEQSGRDVTYYHCSGDPDSLDAVVSQGDMLVDGTAPHVYDPALPGAAGGVVNLGACLDEAALMRDKGDILRLGRRSARAYARAYRYLAGARGAREDSRAVYASAVDQGALCNLRLELMRRIRGENGCAKRAYAQAITHKGLVQHVESALRAETVCLDLPFGMDADCVLRPLAAACQARGIGSLTLMDALDDSLAAHLATDAFSVVSFVEPGRETRALPFDESILKAEQSALSFSRAAYSLLLGQAVESLREAKEAHDALERLYIDAMDYARYEEMAREALDKLR